MTLDVLEALLFIQPDPVTLEQLARWLACEPEAVQTGLVELESVLSERRSGLTVQWVDGGVRLATHPRLAQELAERITQVVPEPLSHASWEVLAIVSYQQPITRLEIEAIRQTGSERAIETLINRELIEEVGRKETPGRPILYGTTRQFLRDFGLSTVDQLPELPPQNQEPTA